MALTGSANNPRALWASINTVPSSFSASMRNGQKPWGEMPNWNKILLSWRMLPGDRADQAFDIYRNGEYIATVAGRTNFRDTDADLRMDNEYEITLAGSREIIGQYILCEDQTYSTHYVRGEAVENSGVPYTTIPLRETLTVNPNYVYKANDISVGDLDGDGLMEIVVKRLAYAREDYEAPEGVDRGLKHTTMYEAYRLDGAFMWRVMTGPNIEIGNGASFAIADFDGDGIAEVVVRTSDGAVFGDGQEMGDSDADGVIDYRIDGQAHMSSGPEYISVLSGTTGAELARADYIPRGESEDWGDNYFKRASSYRVGVAYLDGQHPSILMCRGIYARSAIWAWDWNGTSLECLWQFDTGSDFSDPFWGQYMAQGYHSLSVGDVDADGNDEIVYGSMTVDHDGSPLNTCGLGHGDALHLGKFVPWEEGLQIWGCYETGTVGAALRNASDGTVRWQYDSTDDVGRAMVGDIDPDSPGCEMWWYGSNVHSAVGEDLGYKPSSCNMAIWFTGHRNRQLLNGTTIDYLCGAESGRALSCYYFGAKDINDSKQNPCWYGDLVGDWREEVIYTDDSFEECLYVFSTFYECDFALPWLFTDHVYAMSALNQNIGYNQPTHTGYYLGSDGDIAEIQTEAGLASMPDVIFDEENMDNKKDFRIFDLQGRQVTEPLSPGLYIQNGKKFYIK